MKSADGARKALTILLVEDDPEAIGFLFRLIAKRFPGGAIHRAENGQRGLELFKEHRPDIVITDISMPVMNGIEMAENIKALAPASFIIAATAKNDTQYLLDAIKVGIDRYVLKPIDIEKLFEAMDACLARNLLNRQLREQQDFIRKLSLAVEQSSDIIMIAGSRGTIEYVNPVFVRTTGYSAQEVLGQSLRTIMTGSTPSDSYELLWSTITRGLNWSSEFACRTKNGGLICLQASVSPLSCEEGNKFVAVMRDVSERKKAEEKIRLLNGELEQRVRARTAELESFCYSVSHDLRAPLRGMAGFSCILQEKYSGKLDETGNDYLRRIQAAAERMGQLIDNLLNLAQVTRGPLRFERVDLSALASKAVQVLVDREPERHVETTIAQGIETEGDPDLLGLVLENLLGNSWKYTRKGTRPSIEFGKCILDGKTVYFVRDNGIGFDMAHASMLFRPFHRLHAGDEFEGNGIGLATVERIVARHGGRVWAKGEPGKGAQFFFTLGSGGQVEIQEGLGCEISPRPSHLGLVI
jgi:PAS domain S-box-containing protein